MIGRGLLVLAAILFVGCKTPGLESVRELRLYELSGSRRLVCEVLGDLKGGKRRTLRCTSPDGERFQGEWMLYRENEREAQGVESDENSSLPGLNRATRSTWEWAQSLGVDLEKRGTRYIFLLYGDRGTVIDGLLMGETEHGEGYLGAARDNKGRKYRIMG